MTSSRPHPLHALKPSEIQRSAKIVTKKVRQTKNVDASSPYPINFKGISLHEPPKAILLPYLDAESEGNVPIESRPFVPRLATVVYALENEREVIESVVSLDSGVEVSFDKAGEGKYSSLDKYAKGPSFEQGNDLVNNNNQSEKS